MTEREQIHRVHADFGAILERHRTGTGGRTADYLDAAFREFSEWDREYEKIGSFAVAEQACLLAAFKVHMLEPKTAFDKLTRLMRNRLPA